MPGSFPPYVPRSRAPKDNIVLHNVQFCKFVGKRYGVSHEALRRALRLLSDGVIDAMSEGYNVSVYGLGCFESRQLKPRKRWNRRDKVFYISEPSTVVHFKKSGTLTDKVRKKAQDKLDNISTTPTVTT